MNAIESTTPKPYIEPNPASQFEKINNALKCAMSDLTKDQLIESIAEYFSALLPNYQTDLGYHLIEKSIIYRKIAENKHYQFTIPIYRKMIDYRIIQQTDDRFESVMYNTFVNYQFIKSEAEKYSETMIIFIIISW